MRLIINLYTKRSTKDIAPTTELIILRDTSNKPSADVH